MLWIQTAARLIDKVGTWICNGKLQDQKVLEPPTTEVDGCIGSAVREAGHRARL